jgi:UDP-N-acetylmuramate: L-alanyl-gamma-D-glutamyl-meso-diaminopimelate ligase
MNERFTSRWYSADPLGSTELRPTEPRPSEPRNPDLAPHDRPLSVHVIAIGGTGMAPFACLMQALGHHVRGADGPLYPPMSTLLAEAGIVPLVGYDASHLDPTPDLVVVGNAVRRDNPEAVEAERRQLPMLSMPEALYRFCLAQRKPLVVAGTHGKTTTTAMAAFALRECGGDPGYLIGGAPFDLPASWALGSGPRFVVEGDEYNAAYFDRGPKFLHYRPQTLIWTSGEYDHADLYADHATLLAAYQKLLAGMPADGLVVACGDRPEVREMAPEAPCRVVLYGLEPHNDVRPERAPEERDGAYRCVVTSPWGKAELAPGLGGLHNLQNALAVWAAVTADGHAPEKVAAALGRFRGVQRRLQELGTEGGVTVVDDFAHHPTAVAATLDALRKRYPGRRLLAALELRSLSAARALFFDGYLDALRRADRAFLPPLFHAARLPPEERLDLDALARRLGELGTETVIAPDYEAMLATIVEAARAGDVIGCMSSGSFGGLQQKLVVALRERAAAAVR